MVETADGRVYKRKRIKDPTDENNYIDIPVLYEARFKTMQEQAQESFLYFNNSSTSSRKTHIKRVTNNQDALQYVDVERIDEWYSKTTAEQAQEKTFILRNTDPPPMQPDGTNNPAHEQTHIVRYYPGNVGGENRPWVDVELIDSLKIIDASSQYQEWIWYLKHPELGDQVNDSTVAYFVTQGFCDSSLELAPAEANFDPPYRLDVFQNIINCNWISEAPTASVEAILWCHSVYPFGYLHHLDYSGGNYHVHSFYAFYLQLPGDPAPTLGSINYDAGNLGNLTWDQWNAIEYNRPLDEPPPSHVTLYTYYEAELMALQYPRPEDGKLAVVQFTISDETA